MNIKRERSDVMVLEDYNLTSFLFSFLFFIGGVYLILFAQANDQMVKIMGGAIFAIIGLAILLTTKVINIRLDKATGKCSFSIWKILGAERKECSISEIKEVQLKRIIKTLTEKGRQTSHYYYTLIFFLQDGRELRFEFGKIRPSIVDVLHSPYEKKTQEAKQVADFLGVPFKQII